MWKETMKQRYMRRGKNKDTLGIDIFRYMKKRDKWEKKARYTRKKTLCIKILSKTSLDIGQTKLFLLLERPLYIGRNSLQHTATYCNALQHTATHCNTLVAITRETTVCSQKLTATHCNTLQHTATRSNTPEHTATPWNTLQHTTTHCNTLQPADYTNR